MDYLKTKIGKLVATDYRFAPLFRKYNIDFCCGGSALLGEVCETQRIDKETMLQELESISQDAKNRDHTIEQMSVTDLVDHIQEIHHSYVLKSIPPLVEFTQKVSNAHGERLPYVNDIANKFRELAHELLGHLEKEEQDLFPVLRTWDRSGNAPDDHTIEHLLVELSSEHEHAGDILKEINILTDNFTPPIGACMTHKVSYAMLKEFEEDLHRHIHLENNILFKRVEDMAHAV